MFGIARIARKIAGSGFHLPLATAIACLTAASVDVRAQSGFDITSVPRPDGAEISSKKTDLSSMEYDYPSSVADAAPATEQALNAGGWVRYRVPDDGSSSFLRFKNGRLGITVLVGRVPGRSDRSRISYSHNNSMTVVPFPEDATDIVYDERRPYLSCITSAGVDATLEFFTRGLAAEGWSVLAADAIAARWPNAKMGDAVEGGARAYFNRDGRANQPPVMLTLRRTAEGKTAVDIRIAPFALPQDLPLSQEIAGIPTPQRTKSISVEGSEDSVRRLSRGLVIAEIPAVLAFYRRELTSRGWTENAAGATVSDTSVRLTFSSPETGATLELGQQYDFTTVRLVVQMTEAAVAARAKAKKEEEGRFMRNARQQAEALMAASDAKRLAAVAAAAGAPVENLRPLANATTPIPLPENAAAVDFNKDNGKLEFTSPSNVRSVAAFYRDALKTTGWKEQRSVINTPNMVRMDFAKGSQKLGFTVMQFGANARVSANGSGLQVAAAPADPNVETQKLEAHETSGFPVPKGYTLSAPGSWSMKGGAVAFRREFSAQVPADIGSVLAFYRRELTKRAWKELPRGATVKPDNVSLAFVAPEGPALLSLGRKGRETTISLVVKNPAEAEKANILPPAGQAKVVLGNIEDAEASVTIDRKTFRIPPDAVNSKTPNGPTLNLRPGKYRYVLKRAGKPDHSGDVVVSADEGWALLVGPGGVLPLHMY